MVATSSRYCAIQNIANAHTGKGDIHVDEELEGKKKREVMCLVEKMEVLGKWGRGMSIALIQHHYGGCEEMICLIENHEDIIGE
jgi:hypothetical protein